MTIDASWFSGVDFILNSFEISVPTEMEQTRVDALYSELISKLIH